MKKHITTSIWSTQHPNVGRNVEHLKIVLFSSPQAVTETEGWQSLVKVPSLMTEVVRAMGPRST